MLLSFDYSPFSSPRSSPKLMQCYNYRSHSQLNRYQVVNRALSTKTDRHAMICGRLWTSNEVHAKSKSGCFLGKLKKLEKSNGQVHAINEDDKSISFQSSEGINDELRIIFHPDGEESVVETSERVNRLKRTTGIGFLNNAVILTISTLLLLLVDSCSWKILRLPLPDLHLTNPFLISLSSCVCIGYVVGHALEVLKVRYMRKSLKLEPKQSLNGWNVVPKTMDKPPIPPYSSYKMISPTNGLYFIPVGILVSLLFVGRSVDVCGAVVATTALAIVGIYPTPSWMIPILEAAVALCFYFWMRKADISTPYKMKWVIPCPAPIGLVRFERFYPLITSLCFVFMTSTVDLVEDVHGFTVGTLDGFTVGTTALAFIGMSIAVLPISTDLAVFGVSLAGAGIGFLFENRYRASIYMGRIGTLAVGGALAAMASCTGMFIPLFLSSSVFLLDALPGFIQIFQRKGNRQSQMALFHHRFLSSGHKEPIIVFFAYLITFVTIVLAAYIGLTSV